MLPPVKANHAQKRQVEAKKRENTTVAGLENKARDVIGDRTAKVLTDNFGIVSIDDLLRHYPRRYVVRGELTDIALLNAGDEVTILAEVLSASNRPMRGRKGGIPEAIVTDGSAKLWLTFFNQVCREKGLKPGRQG